MKRKTKHRRQMTTLPGMRRVKRPSSSPRRAPGHDGSSSACDLCFDSPAPHRVAEQGVSGHPYTAVLCCDCFGRLFGDSAAVRRCGQAPDDDWSDDDWFAPGPPPNRADAADHLRYVVEAIDRVTSGQMNDAVRELLDAAGPAVEQRATKLPYEAPAVTDVPCRP